MKERAAKLGHAVIYFFKQNGLQRHQLETGEVVCVCVCVCVCGFLRELHAARANLGGKNAQESEQAVSS
jgi:hypothetical protein